MNRAFAAIGALLLLGAAVLIGLRLADPPSSPPEAASPGAPKRRTVVALTHASGPADPTVGSSDSSADSPLPPSGEVQATASTSSPPTPAPPISGAELVERWLTTTDAVAGAVTVLQHWSSLKPDEQLPALGRVLNMLPDSRYESARRVLFDPATCAEAAEVIFHDAVNRSTEVKLPVMLALISKPTHPLAAMAHNALMSELGADYGANQGEWVARVHEYLQRQAQVGK